MKIQKNKTSCIANKKSWTLLFTAALVLLLSSKLEAQVTIGNNSAPARAALLELKDRDPNPTSVTDDTNITSTVGGLLLPRVKLVAVNTLEPFIATASTDWTNLSLKTREKHAGLLVYNLQVDTAPNGFKQGVYEWDGEKWRIVLSTAQSVQTQNFFYMPSFNLPTTTVANGVTFDLYAEYESQFKQAGNTNFVSSNPVMAEVPSIYDRAQLDYVVTDYDNTVITVNSISATGVMNYDVLSVNPPLNSYINIIFVVK